MSEPIISALIGLFGVVVGVFLGWFLKERTYNQRERRDYKTAQIQRLQHELLNAASAARSEDWDTFNSLTNRIYKQLILVKEIVPETDSLLDPEPFHPIFPIDFQAGYTGDSISGELEKIVSELERYLQP